MQKLSNFIEMKNENFTAVFVNENNVIPKEIKHLGIYKYSGDPSNSSEFNVSELCLFTYLFEDMINYTLFKWVDRLPKPLAGYTIKAILDGQKGLENLLY